jgi:hypothetical protein
MTQDFPVVIRCTRLEKPLAASWTSWASFWKIIRMIG